MIERAIVREQGWLTPAEYVQCVALAQLSPGINLLGLTILIGRRLGGAAGILLSLLGLLLPSVTITVLMTAGYAHFQHRPVVQAALHGVIPATVGLGLLTAFNLARGLFDLKDRRPADFGAGLVLLVGSGLVLALGHLPVILILCGAGLVGAVLANCEARDERPALLRPAPQRLPVFHERPGQLPQRPCRPDGARLGDGAAVRGGAGGRPDRAGAERAVGHQPGILDLRDARRRLALLAIVLPPLLVLVIERFYRRVQHHPAVEGFVRGLGLAAVGIFGVVLFGLLRSAGLTPRNLLIALASLALGATRRVPAIVILGLAATAGIITG